MGGPLRGHPFFYPPSPPTDKDTGLYYICMLLTILHHYLLWHYWRAWQEMWHVSRNLLWFVINFFSLPQLIRSLFSPWRRISEERARGFDLETLAGYVIINLMSRLIGFIIRLSVVIAGGLTLLVLSVGILALFLFWSLAPASIFIFLIFGLMLLL